MKTKTFILDVINRLTAQILSSNIKNIYFSYLMLTNATNVNKWDLKTVVCKFFG